MLRRVGWRQEAWIFGGYFVANPPMGCKRFVLVGWLLRGMGWYRFHYAILFEHNDPPYDWQLDSSLKRLRMTRSIGLRIVRKQM